MPQFSYSLKTQQKAAKKIFSVDSGLANTIAFKFSEDKGRLLEQSVFLELKRRGVDAYYYKTKNNKEVDFLVKQKNQKKDLIQVCWDITEEDTKKREIDNILQAMQELRIKKGIILTFNSELEVRVDNKVITVLPVYKFMINKRFHV